LKPDIESQKLDTAIFVCHNGCFNPIASKSNSIDPNLYEQASVVWRTR
jgi:hypothetical protein